MPKRINTLQTAFFIAFKSITRGNKSTAALLIFILSLSFLNMMFITGIISGVTKTMLNLVVNTATSHIIISPQQTPQLKQFITNQAELRTKILTIPGVIAAARHYLTGASISYDKDKTGSFKIVSGQVIGIDPTNENNVLTIKKYLVAGQFLDDADTDQILLSAAIAGGYGLPLPSDLGGAKVGDKVRVIYGNGVMRAYTVKGIYSITFGTALSGVYVTAKEAESVLSTYDEATQILVKVDTNRGTLDYYQNKIQNMAPSLRVQKYTDILAAVNTEIQSFSLISVIVSVISVIVAAVTIFVIIYVNAVNKRRQIGILKAIGIRESIIVYSYVFQSLFYVFVGIATGSVLVFLGLIPYFNRFPIPLAFGGLSLYLGANAIISAMLSLAIAGLLSGLIPSRIVARQNILEAIWG